MKRIKLVLAYDGTNYCGWQYQNNGLTIEEVLNQSLTKLLGEPVAVIGASRTDAGVHALENVAVFDTENRMAPDKICLALNQWLPDDIRALSSEEVPLNWHPRKQNCTKTYEYRILNRKINLPTERLYSYFCYFPLDLDKMREAASYLVGEHDFRSFCTRRGQEEESVRTIYSLDLEKTGDRITIRVSGSGFLYNMVRIIAGTLIKVGIGVYPPEHVEEILDARDRRAAGPTAPAKGLTLVSMEYEKKLRDRIAAENKDWSYELIQREIPEKGKAYLIIRRCAERDFDRLLLRLTHQSMRNGARQVFVCDLEGGRKEECPEGRIVEGKAYGYYTFHHACDVIAMEKTIGAAGAGGVPADGNGSEAVLVNGKSPAAALISGNSSAAVPADGKCFAAVPADLRLTPVTDADVFAFSALANEIFRSVPGFVSVTDAETAEQISGGVKELFFLRADGRNAGILQLAVCGDSLEVERIGIAENDRRKGLALAALAAAERIAAGRGCKRLRLAVPSVNSPALALFEKFGFGREKIVSRWYSWSDERT